MIFKKVQPKLSDGGPEARRLDQERDAAVRSQRRLGVAPEPVRETRRTEAWIVTGH
jgi:hypothetical protein